MPMLTLPVLLRGTMRTIITPTICQFNRLLHTTGSSCSAIKTTKDGKKITLDVQPIMECEKHQTIKKELGTDSFTDILVNHILELNIIVPKLSLENNITIYKSNLTNINRTKDVPKHVSSEIKIGRYTKADDQIIKNNWNKLLTEVDLKKEEVKVMQELFNTTSYKANKLLGLKMNILGFFLSKNLPDVRLATEVHHRAKLLLWRQNGKFTPEEDQIIIDMVKIGGDDEQWKELAQLLRRTYARTLKHRFEILKSKEETLSGKFEAKEDEIIILKVFEFHPKIMDEGKISKKEWKLIGKQLNRSSDQVYNRWRALLLPTLKKYHVGTQSTDLRQVLVTHMIENNLNYAQDVDWKELGKLPQFAGTTAYSLGQLLKSMHNNVVRKHQEINGADITAETLQMYLDNRKHGKGTNAMNMKRDAYKELLVNFYVANILNNE